MRPAPVLALFLLLPGPLLAQGGPPPPGEPRAGSAAALLLKASRIADRERIQLGGWAGLVFGNRLALGGGGVSLLDAVELPGTRAGTGFDLRMGYGGVVLRLWEPLRRGWTGEVGLLLGSGNGEVLDRLTGRELGSDNFLVAEPEGSLSFSLLRHLHVGFSAGHRWVWGVEDLPTVTRDELQAMTWTLFLRVGGS